MRSYSNREIAKKAREKVKKYGTSDPERLFEAMGGMVMYQDLGTDDDSIKAFAIIERQRKRIIVNSNLPEIIIYFIIAHELGHIVLHCKEQKNFFDFGLFDNCNQMEIEAHIFAAELIFGDSKELYKEMHENEDITLFGIAACHNAPYELLAYKLETMEEEGYEVPELPYEPDTQFLLGTLGMKEHYSCKWD